MSGLPASWTRASLAMLCERIVDGSHNPPKPSATGRPMLSARNVHSRKIHFEEMRVISEEDFVQEHARTGIQPRDVLLTIVGTIGRTAVVPVDSVPFALQRSVAVLRATACDPRYLAYNLESPTIQTVLADGAKGTAQKGIYLKALSQLELDIAPFAEQKRIADKLDTVLARVDACRERLDRVPGILSRYRASVLAAATSGNLTKDWRETMGRAGSYANLEGWASTTIGAVIIDLRYGTSKKCDYASSGTHVLRIPNIADHGKIIHEDMKSAHFDANEAAKLALRAGDILIVRSNGSVELVGKAGLVTEHEEGMLFAGYLMRLRMNQELILPAFARICLASPEQRQRIELTSRSTSGVNNINSDEVRALPLLLPPLDEQVEIAGRVEKLFAFADRVEARIEQARLSVVRLSPAILAKAFRGELVPQDPSDEPAADLLKRLEKQSLGEGKATKRARAKRAESVAV